MSDATFVAGLRPIPTGSHPGEPRPAADIVGTTPQGGDVELRIDLFDQLVLLAFLHTECDGCDEFWSGFAGDSGVTMPTSVSPVIVTKGADTISAADVERLAQGIHRLPVVMSDRAWGDYQVLGYPFFVLVDPSSGTVVGETVGFGWSDVISMIRATGT